MPLSACADARMAPLLAGVFAGRGKDAAVFRGDDGLDELTVSTTTRGLVGRGGGQVAERSLDPTGSGSTLQPIEALRGGDAAHNAGVVRDVFAGATGPVRDAVVLNAGIALALTEPDSAAARADRTESMSVAPRRRAGRDGPGRAGDRLRGGQRRSSTAGSRRRAVADRPVGQRPARARAAVATRRRGRG